MLKFTYLSNVSFDGIFKLIINYERSLKNTTRLIMHIIKLNFF